MSKTLSAALDTLLASETMTTATLLLMERTRFTPRVTSITKGTSTVINTDIPHGLVVDDAAVMRDNLAIPDADDQSLRVTAVGSTTQVTVNLDSSAMSEDGALDYGTLNPLLGFTDHDLPITYQNVTYSGNKGYTPSAIANSGDLAVDNLDVYGIIDSDALAEEDIVAGRYDYARMTLFLLNYRDLTDGHMIIKQGRIGEVSMQRDIYTAEFRGLAQALDQDTITHYGPACWADLGDAQCKVDLTLAANNHTGSVTTTIDQSKFIDTSVTGADSVWTGGKLRWTSGNNAGREIEISRYQLNDPDHSNNPTLQLMEAEFSAIQVGDTYTMTRGCDKSHATCRDVFANVINFRGYPHLPGMAEMLNYGNRPAEVE